VASLGLLKTDAVELRNLKYLVSATQDHSPQQALTGWPRMTEPAVLRERRYRARGVAEKLGIW
jgi:hypothetical protein